MLSGLVLEDCDVELLLMSFPGQPARLLKPCWVTALRFGDSQHALSGEIIYADVSTSICPLTISNGDPKVRHLWERSCGKRFRECSIIPGSQKQSFKKSRECTIWLAGLSPRCTSSIKKEKPILAWRCRGGSRGCSFTRLTAACCINHIQFRCFRDDRLVLPNRHLR